MFNTYIKYEVVDLNYQLRQTLIIKGVSQLDIKYELIELK